MDRIISASCPYDVAALFNEEWHIIICLYFQSAGLQFSLTHHGLLWPCNGIYMVQPIDLHTNLF
jgi:hypothetical protein